MNTLSSEEREFVEHIDDEYYKRVKTSEDYYRRKKLILMNLEKLQAKVENHAKNFDEYEHLKFILLEKARQKRSIVKNFVKLEDSYFKLNYSRFLNGLKQKLEQVFFLFSRLKKIINLIFVIGDN